jgi:putative DNA primase/helicase
MKNTSGTKSLGKTSYSAKNKNMSASKPSKKGKFATDNVEDASAAELSRYLAMQCRKSKDDIGVIFEPLCLRAMRLLQEKSPIVYNVLRSKIKKSKHIPLTKLEAAVKHNNSAGNRKVDHLVIAESVIEEISHENMIHVHGTLRLWNGKGCWKVTDTDGISKLVLGLIRRDFSNLSITAGLVNGVVKLINLTCNKSDHEFNLNNKMINCLNGELHHTGKKWVLLPHEKANYCTAQVQNDYEYGAKAPIFIQFLKSIYEGDDQVNEKIRLVLELIGYSLTTNCRLEKFIILVGEGANGKGVLLRLIQSLVGKNNVGAVHPSQFGNQFQRASLEGKYVNIVTELNKGASFNEDVVKSITSGEVATVENKNDTPHTMNPFATLWFACNVLPPMNDSSQGTRRRAMVIQFNRVFEEHEQDSLLEEKLVAELPGIFRLAVKHFGNVLKREHFTKVREVENAVESWTTALDPVAQFVKSKCVLGDEYSMPAIDCYRAYLNWTSQNGIDDVISQIALTMRLKPLGVTKFKRNTGQQLRGIKLR